MKGALQTDRTIEKLKAIRETIVSQCKREATKQDPRTVCTRSDGECCGVYAFPKAMWRLGHCPMADENLIPKIVEINTEKVRVGQQKQKKKSKK